MTLTKILMLHSHSFNAPAAGYSVGLDGCSEPSCVIVRHGAFSQWEHQLKGFVPHDAPEALLVWL